jgi:tetratricopeptide (TPR) repeat protein
MFCEKCGTQLEDGAQLCPNCGRPTVAAQQPAAAAGQPDAAVDQPDVAAVQPEAVQPEAVRPDAADEQPNVTAGQYEAASVQPAAVKPVKKKKKGLKIFLFVLAGLIVLGAAGYFGAVQWARSKNYKDAVALMESGNYTYAYDLFSALGDYKDSAALAEECDHEIDYQAAMGAYDEGLYFTAYQAFCELGTYKDSVSMAAQCVQSDPANGLLYFNDAYASSSVSFTVSTGNNSGYNTYLKFYSSGGELVACVFVASNSTAMFQLSPGQYSINKAMGADWFGMKEMFGDSGSYVKVMFDNETTDIITLQANHLYTLTFDVADASGDDVGDESIDSSDF